jgi:RNA polymerase sigma-70 factor, ECF subfamily
MLGVRAMSAAAGSTEVETVARVFREDRRRLLATLIRLVGDMDLAEESLAAAFEAALRQWRAGCEAGGVPENAGAWLIRTARNKAIDTLRHRTIATEKSAELQSELVAFPASGGVTDAARHPRAIPDDEVAVEDDQLRLIFTCCHPALPLEAQVALTLRTLGGLETEEIARAFLVPTTTMAQRLVRAKTKIRLAKIPYRIPDAEDLPERLEAVLAVVYLIFNEGYAASGGDALVRADLCAEATRLGRLLVALAPARPEPRALLALMLLVDARRPARVAPDGELVLLEDQDRTLWDGDAIAEGLALVREVLPQRPLGTHAVQAAIAAIHAQAERAADTDWRQIAALYGLLSTIDPSPVVALNHAAAIAMADGPAEGLRRMDALTASGTLAGYHLLPAARADLLRRMGRFPEAARAYREALGLVTNAAETRFLQRRLAEVGGGARSRGSGAGDGGVES